MLCLASDADAGPELWRRTWRQPYLRTLWMTLHPAQRPKTEPLVQACGLTGRMLVVPHRLHVNLICAEL